MAMKRSPLYLSVNSFRCLRDLNKERSHVPKAPETPEQTGLRHNPRIPLELRLLIDHLRVSPIGPRGALIGAGGSGTLRLFEDPTTRQQIAVKHISVIDSISLEREVETLVRLRHPCIVRILAWSPATDSSGGEIQMEYAPNGSLAATLCSSRNPAIWTPTRIAIVICDIALGLRYMHSQGIVHGDLKPGNIVLDRELRAKICDFGLSRSLNLEDARTGEIGTFAYMAPEQLQGDLSPTEKTDVFAFGLVLYEIISCKRAFGENQMMPVLKLHRARYRPTLSDEFGHLMQNLIPRCWSDRPRSRPSFAQILSEFESAGFALLPGADACEIEAAARRISAVEQSAQHII
jgi:serine/threonine protein kinase